MTATPILPKELGQMIEWRRALHANPEVSGSEQQTRAFLLQQLERLAIPVQTFETHAGIVATLEGKSPGGVIALRADMDALPVNEETGQGRYDVWHAPLAGSALWRYRRLSRHDDGIIGPL